MPEFEVYTTGGGYHLSRAFNFLALFSSGNQILDMMQMGAAAGIIYLVLKILITGNMAGTLQYLVVMTVLSGLSIGAKARVVVMDTTYPLEIYGTVDNVPLSIAFVSSVTSSIGYHLTRRMETLLAAPDDLSYQKHGIIFGAALMSQATRWRAVSPKFEATLANFMENCIIDGANIGLIDLDSLTRSGDLVNYLDSETPSSLAFYNIDTEATEACSDGWPGLKAQLAGEVQKVLNVQAASRAPLSGNSAGVASTAALTGSLEAFQQHIGMTGYSATNYLQQTMMVMSMSDGLSRLISTSGNGAAMDQYQAARAEQQTAASYSAVATQATKWVPLAKIVFEVIYVAAFPLALIMFMTPLGPTVVRGYFSGFVWLAAWEPLNAILHTTITEASSGFYRDNTTTWTGTSAEQLLTWANHVGIQSVEQSVGTAAGVFMMMIPVLIVPIFFGAGKMGQLATSMLNVSQGAAIETGREAATGNISHGNVSMHNFNANKWNGSGMMDHGRMDKVAPGGARVVENRDGTKIHQSGSQLDSSGLSGGLSNAFSSEVSERLSDSRSAVSSHGKSFAQSINKVAEQVSDFTKSAVGNKSAGTDRSSSIGNNSAIASANLQSYAKDFSKTYGISEEKALKAMAMGSVGITGKAAVGAQAQISGSLSASEQKAFSEISKASQSGDIRKSFDTVTNAIDKNYSGLTSSVGQSAANTWRSNLAETTNSAVNLNEAYEEAQRYEAAQSNIQSNGGNMTGEAATTFRRYMQNVEGFGDEYMGNLLAANTAPLVKERARMIDKHIGGFMDQVGYSGGVSGARPANTMGTSPDQMHHVPVDAAKAQEEIQTPEVGNFDLLKGVADDNFSHRTNRITGGLVENTSHVQWQVGATTENVEQGNKTGVGRAFVNNAVDASGQIVHGVADIVGAGNITRAIPGVLSDVGNDINAAIKPKIKAFDQAAESVRDDFRMATGIPDGGIFAQSDNAPTPPTRGNVPDHISATTERLLPDNGQSNAAFIDSQGFYRSKNVSYAIGAGTIRNEAPAPEIMQNIDGVVQSMGPEYGFVATSAAQPAAGDGIVYGVDRVGSERHDHEVGAVDGYLTRNGDKLNPDDHRSEYAQFIQHAAEKFEGIGHYEWGVHVGHGDPALWGPDKTSETALPLYSAAYNKGRASS